jgi:hypothetical protein
VSEQTPWYADLRPPLFDDLPRAAQQATKATRGALGLVIEVPVDGGIDTVGAYADGAFRYYNAIRGATLVEPGGLPAINAAARDLVLLANGLVASIVPTGSMKMTIIDSSGKRTSAGSDRIGQLVSAKALQAVTTCMAMREPGAAAPITPDPAPIAYLHQVVATATPRNANCRPGERHRIMCWSTSADKPIGAFFAGVLFDQGWSDITIEKIEGYTAIPEWTEPRDPNLVAAFEQAMRVGWSLLVFREPA